MIFEGSKKLKSKVIYFAKMIQGYKCKRKNKIDN